jgi:hypothetical protein
MAYPIKLFEFNEENLEKGEEGNIIEESYKFIENLEKNMDSLFGQIYLKDTTKEYFKWDVNEVPQYIKDVGLKSVQKIVKDIKGDLKWKATISVGGRKTGMVIKKEDDILYRVIIHLGSPEIYYMVGEGFNWEPVVLPNGWGLLCSPATIDNIDFKIKKEPIRKGLNSELLNFVTRVRLNDYMRTTIVLDLMLDGVDMTDLQDKDKTCPPTLDEP